MKGGKNRNSNSGQTQLESPPGRSDSSNGGSDSAAAAEDDGGSKREDSQRPISADEALNADGGEERDSAADEALNEDGGEERDSAADEALNEDGGEERDSAADDNINEQPEQGERPKLAECYYEIEDVRSKRIRRGKKQYLIKWRGWPGTFTSWEPSENLQPLLIEIFEQSLKAMKGTHTKKRKASNHLLPKKKQRGQRQQSPPTLTPVRIADETTTSPTENELVLGNGHSEVNTKGGSTDENSVKRVSPVGKEQTEPMEEMTTIVESDDRVALPFGASQETFKTGVQNEIAPIQPCRHTGAKRRKSGPVKRFKKDPVSSAVEMADASPSNVPVNNSNGHNEHEDPCRSFTITEIIKPTIFSPSTSDGANDAFLSFEALRSDGTKTTVTNNYLKVKHPLLLIDYYERNLRYTPLR